MSFTLVLSLFVGYFGVIFLISYLSTVGATSNTFFNADRRAPWFAVAFGMVSAALPGIGYVFIPGSVLGSEFSYLQLLFGYVVGYLLVSNLLLPIYYSHRSDSIYSYLEGRLGFWSHKTGALFFMISRLLRAAFTLYVTVEVLQYFAFDEVGIPFWLTLFLLLLGVWLYTFRGGLATLIWSDVWQTTLVLSSLGVIIYMVNSELHQTFSDGLVAIQEGGSSQAFFWESGDTRNFFRQFFLGILAALVINGLDLDMMQKHLACRQLADSQKSVVWFSLLTVGVSLLLLVLGGLLVLFVNSQQIAMSNTEYVFPIVVKMSLGVVAQSAFVLGLLSACCSTSDSALVALTTSYCNDFLDYNKYKTGEATKRMRRIQTHLVFVLLLFFLVLSFKLIDIGVIRKVYDVSSFTYGPLFGLFAFALLTRWKVKDVFVPLVCVVAPLICYVFNVSSQYFLGEYQIGDYQVLISGVITFVGLLLLIRRN